MTTQKTQREAATIKHLKDEVESFREKSSKIRKEDLTNESCNTLATLSVKIYQGERKIENLNNGLPAYGYADIQYSLITNDRNKNNYNSNRNSLGS